MNRFPSPIRSRVRSITLIVAATTALSSWNSFATTALQTDAPETELDDAATEAQVANILRSVDASMRTFGLASPHAGAAKSFAQKFRGGGSRYGFFPGVTQTNLVANKPEFGALTIEPDLKNPWGIAIRPAGFGGHFWVAAANSGKSIQYVGDVGSTPLFQDELKIVDTRGPASGVAFNPGTGFVITQPHANGPITNSTKFFFANLSGTITAWTERARADGGFDRPADSITVVDGTARHASFSGVTVSPKNDRMFAADFGADAALRVYDSAFVEQPSLTNPFQPEGAKQPGGFEAFNVQTVGNRVFAMYGRHVAPDPNNPPPAEGRLAEFDADGQLIAKWHGRGYLNYPWGVALAPDNFGLYAGCMLVGNFGDGTVVAFHPRLKVALDYVRDDHGSRVVIDGLWGLQFGNGASLGESNHVYFAAGPDKEADGLFGKLEPNPRTLPYLHGISLCK
jgi:uncharacterized protein (TIGR03118 family)